MKRLIRSAAFAIVLVGFVWLGFAQDTDIIYVDGTYGDDANDGSSWQAAVKTIQRGLDLAGPTGWTVVVAPGMYTGAGNKDLDFRGKAVHLVSIGGAENCIIECEGSGRGFYFHSGETAESIVRGFTITNGNAHDGGAIYCYLSSPTVTDCIIRRNSAMFGAGIAIRGYRPKDEDSAIEPNPVIVNCVVEQNRSTDGGGIFSHFAKPLVVNCIFTKNEAQFGGAIADHSSRSTVTNCTVVDNTAIVRGGGIYCNGECDLTVNNTIIWANLTQNEGNQIWAFNSTMTLNYCCYADNTLDANNVVVLWGTLTEQGICIHEDPLFVDAAGGNYRLQATSPCIDAGSNALVPESITTDLDGNPRTVDGDLDGVETVDMGAYEYQLVTDITPPAITIVYPVEGETWYWGETRHCEFYAEDDLSGIKSVEASVNGMPVESCQPITVSELAVGENILTVRAQDNAGNVSEEAVKFFVDVNFDGTIDIVDGFYFEGLITTWGTANSLIQHLQNAQIKEQEGKFHIAIHQLDAFVTVLGAQRAISIKEEAYQLLFACQDELRMPFVEKPLEVVKEFPGCGAVDVSPFTKIWFKFSAPVNPETVDSDTFKICVLAIEPPVTAEAIAAAKKKARANPCSNECVPVDGTYSFEHDNTVAVFTPSQPLPYGTTIYRGVGEYVEGKSIEDTYGNPLKGVTHCYFCTVPVPVVDIDADVDKDGDVSDTGYDEDHEEDVGILVICDKEGVYKDKDEPARRREIVVRAEGGTGEAIVGRSSANLKLYDARTGGNEQFKGKMEIKLSPGSYWLQGGSTPSQSVRDEYLEVRVDEEWSDWSDEINVTVLWVEIVPHNSGKLWPSPLYDGHDYVVDYTGHEDLGVQIAEKKSPFADKMANGCIQFIGWIDPWDLSFDKKITSGFKKDKEKDPAEATFGFVWRRFVTCRRYSDGQSKPTEKKDEAVDDNFRDYQDPDPDNVNNFLIIADSDGPGPLMRTPHFMHTRFNFTHHVVWYWRPKEPERCSAKLKWACSIDIAPNYKRNAVYIFGLPNDGDDINEVKPNWQIKDLSLKLPAAKLKDAWTKIENGKKVRKVKNRGAVEVTVEGSNMVGEFYLVRGRTEFKAFPVLVKETDEDKRYSDLTEAKITFDLYRERPSKGWKLVIRRDGKDVSKLEDFEVVAEE